MKNRKRIFLLGLVCAAVLIGVGLWRAGQPSDVLETGKFRSELIANARRALAYLAESGDHSGAGASTLPDPSAARKDSARLIHEEMLSKLRAAEARGQLPPGLFLKQ